MANRQIVRNRVDGRAAARDRTRLRKRGEGIYVYRALDGEDALTIARWFSVAPSSIPYMLRLNKPLLVNGTLPRLREGQEIRIPALWTQPEHAAHPSRRVFLSGLGLFDDDETEDPPDPPKDCGPGGYEQSYPPCGDGYSWSWGCCKPESDGGDASKADGMPCGNPNGGTVYQGGICVCNESGGYTYSSSEDRCVPVGEPCNQDGGIWNSSGECVGDKEVGDKFDKKCCPNGGDGVSNNRLNDDCSLTQPSKITAAGAPECTQYDACLDDFIPIAGCTPKGKDKPGSGTPSGQPGTPGKKKETGTKPDEKKDKSGEKASTPMSSTTYGLIGVGIAGAAAAVWWWKKKRKKSLPRRLRVTHQRGGAG